MSSILKEYISEIISEIINKSSAVSLRLDNNNYGNDKCIFYIKALIFNRV